jgi:hypothetical protein
VCFSTGGSHAESERESEREEGEREIGRRNSISRDAAAATLLLLLSIPFVMQATQHSPVLDSKLPQRLRIGHLVRAPEKLVVFERSGETLDLALELEDSLRETDGDGDLRDGEDQRERKDNGKADDQRKARPTTLRYTPWMLRWTGCSFSALILHRGGKRTTSVSLLSASRGKNNKETHGLLSLSQT